MTSASTTQNVQVHCFKLASVKVGHRCRNFNKKSFRNFYQLIRIVFEEMLIRLLMKLKVLGVSPQSCKMKTIKWKNAPIRMTVTIIGQELSYSYSVENFFSRFRRSNVSFKIRFQEKSTPLSCCLRFKLLLSCKLILKDEWRERERKVTGDSNSRL